MDTDPSGIVSWFNAGWQIGGFLIGVIAAYLAGHKKGSNTADHPKNADITPAFQTKQTIISDQLVSLRILTNAARTRLAQFHNGGRFLDGSSVKRFSITHESCEIGIPFEATSFQNIVVTVFWDLITLTKSNKAEVVFVKDLPEGLYRSYCRSHGIDAILVLPIRKDELYTGSLIVEWCDIDKVPQDLETVKKVAEEHRTKIEVEMLLGK